MHLRSVKLSNLDYYSYIDVINTSVPELCANAITDLSYLRSLSLNYLGIGRIEPGSFGNLPNLRYLALSLNNITYLRKGVFNGMNLVKLYLSANSIQKIDPEAFDHMPYLETLFLDRNQIQQLDGRWFARCPKIRMLNLNFNQIAELPGHAFKSLVSEQNELVIKLHHNGIRQISNKMLRGNEYNLILQLGHNKINGVFTVDLYENVKHIKELDLKANGIHCVTERVIHRIANSRFRLNLYDNPIDCTCLRLMEKYREIQRNIAFYPNSNCLKLVLK